MNRRDCWRRACALVLAVAPVSRGHAQMPPPARPLGAILARSTEPMVSVSQVRALPGGRVIVNDRTGRRVLMFDSTLALLKVIADTTSRTARAYGNLVGGVIKYLGDSTLLVDPGTLSMQVIDGDGIIRRTIAVPRPRDAVLMIGAFGTPGLDARGRLVYRGLLRRPLSAQSVEGAQSAAPPDTVPIIAVSLGTRQADTLAWMHIAVPHLLPYSIEFKGRTVVGTSQVLNPIPRTDEWAMLSSGVLAIVSGVEYRVRFIDADGRVTVGPRIPFEWERLSDADKQRLIDSAKVALDSEVAALKLRQDSAGEANGRRGVQAMPPIPADQFVSLDEMPEYNPAFTSGAVRGDEDGYLWVRTTKIENGGRVYDVIDSDGTLVDQIRLPAGRIIAGFGPGGVVYMGMLDGKVARVERAKVRVGR